MVTRTTTGGRKGVKGNIREMNIGEM
ncbi:hypothetical protein CR513_42376 [Mucuna pruriens]|uniref:Uncharacterized protein n=1 Tax=Mucuna pruriens TaxID=157652 RepID=A0A371FGV4_MUCPR|nr:hypothetical protein CR513_42376 [Mucuna pruriens]